MSNSVFEDSGDAGGDMGGPGMVTPLPGTLGSVSHTPLPREAPRAVFDEDGEQEPTPAAEHAHAFARPKSSVGSVQNNPGLF